MKKTFLEWLKEMKPAHPIEYKLKPLNPELGYVRFYPINTMVL